VKTYAIRDIFLTIQGEGARAGTRALFVRFAGCNLWNGLPQSRDKGEGPCAQWCDADFAKGRPYSASALIEKMCEVNGGEPADWCVLTGGEPALQIDDELMSALALAGWSVAVETNGTIKTDALLRADWITTSPKRGTTILLDAASELKIVLPGETMGAGWTAAELEQMRQQIRPHHCFVQPLDPILDPSLVETTALQPKARPAAQALTAYQSNLTRCIDFVLKHPAWRVSLQTHKMMNVP